MVELDLPASAHCTRVAVVDGHTECVSLKLSRPPTTQEIIEAWQGVEAEPQRLALPTAPARPIRYSRDDRAPQPRLHRRAGGGMAVTIGRLRSCPLLDWKFVALSHNTIRGAAELAVARRVVGSLKPPSVGG